MVAHLETRIFHPGQLYTEPVELPARSERAGRSRSSVEFE